MISKNIVPDEARSKGYLFTIPDEVTMTREYFASILRRVKHHRDVSFGFSRKHTSDIMLYRKSVKADESTLPSNLYSFPVSWNEEITYVK